MTANVLYLSGYRASEMGVFSKDDPKIQVIKKAIKGRLERLLDDGLEWVLVGGNLGVETWGAEVVLELKKEYEALQLGVVFPFASFGENWNEHNRFALESLSNQADFVTATSSKPYTDPSQLRMHTAFMIQKSQATLLVYDDEYEGKAKWLKQSIQKEQEKRTYPLYQIDMYELEENAYDPY